MQQQSILKVGCCGWSYFPEKGDKLINYAKEFDVVEVNSTFYRLPRISTAKKWREKADSINPSFEFTVKVNSTITHKDRFSGKVSIEAFESTKEVARELRARFLVFQSPASFRPTEENIEKARKFFNKIDREGFILGWEVRWKDSWKRSIVRPLFEELDLEHVVDPLRQPSYRKKVGYYRLHGFGEKMMYNYIYSKQELKEIAKKVRRGYVMFNNFAMYKNAKEFKKIIKSRKATLSSP